jgi:seryl-tRNA synthetase
MIDPLILREQTEWLQRGIEKKCFRCDLGVILAMDGERRKKITELEALKQQQNAANQLMASLPKNSPEFVEKLGALKEIAHQVKALEAQAKVIEQAWDAALLTIPNVPHESVPLGKHASDNVTMKEWGDRASISPHAKPHYDILHFDSLIDFQRGCKVTGAGFPFYIGDMARLVRALLQFFLDEARVAGYTEFLPPILVNVASATATGQLPDKEDMMYEATKDHCYLVPTAEVPVTNFFRDEIVAEKQLPLYRCAYTPCFRREAGSWGKEVRGLNRLHQFDKVELVKWVHPDTSLAELDSLREDAERLLQKLELPYRVLLICAGDMGFPHSKQYDLEVWAGGQQRWLEVSSCSNFTDFQARRANIRFRQHDTQKTRFVHTLNGSGLAIPRVLAALLENNLQADNTILIPKVLQPYTKFDSITPAASF